MGVWVTNGGKHGDGYKEKVADLEVQLVRDIKIPSAFRNGVGLNKKQRETSIYIQAYTHFQVSEETGQVKHKLSKEGSEYRLQISIPEEVEQDLDTTLILTHPLTKQTTPLKVTY